MLSLRFLAWHFLGETIQSGAHDSIEDAKTALRLYRKYEELEKEGKVNASLELVYDVGMKHQWKVPNSKTPTVPME